jgi:hypothetical protein
VFNAGFKSAAGEARIKNAKKNKNINQKVELSHFF